MNAPKGNLSVIDSLHVISTPDRLAGNLLLAIADRFQVGLHDLGAVRVICADNGRPVDFHPIYLGNDFRLPDGSYVRALLTGGFSDPNPRKRKQTYIFSLYKLD